MSFSTVKKFIYALDDKDFLSIVEGADFYNKKVTLKRYYYNRLFGTIKSVVDISTKADHQKLASIIKKLVLERLGRVNQKSFVRYFTSKLFHSKRDTILDHLRDLADALQAEAAKTPSLDGLVDLDKWILSASKHFKRVIKLFSKKNNVSYSIPDLRERKGSPYRFEYSASHNAFYIDSEQSLEDMKISYICLFFEYLLAEANLPNNELFKQHVVKFARLTGINLPPELFDEHQPFEQPIQPEDNVSEEEEEERVPSPPEEKVLPTGVITLEKGLIDILGNEGFNKFMELDINLFSDEGFMDSFFSHISSGISEVTSDQIKAIRSLFNSYLEQKNSEH